MKFDFLIVGQGLAGTVLAYTLIQRGKRVCVIDDHHRNASTLVAAGMWNPIVFRRINKSWMADEFLPALDHTYGGMGQLLGKTYLHHRDIIRVFPNQQAANEFGERMDSPGFSKLLELVSGDEFAGVKLPFGAGKVKGGGYVDLEQLIPDFRNWLLVREWMLEEAFEYSALEIRSGGVNYKSHQAAQVIFCQGFQNVHNPWFGGLPLRSTKGEVLRLKAEGWEHTEILNNGRFLLPLGNGEFKLGATYDWHTQDPSVTEAARKTLLTKAAPILPPDYEVKEQLGGIRPTVVDRRPLLGRHPDHPSLVIFNGLGTRGVMLAPWLANHLADHLLEGQTLIPEADIRRFE